MMGKVLKNLKFPPKKYVGFKWAWHILNQMPLIDISSTCTWNLMAQKNWKVPLLPSQCRKWKQHDACLDWKWHFFGRLTEQNRGQPGFIYSDEEQPPSHHHIAIFCVFVGTGFPEYVISLTAGRIMTHNISFLCTSHSLMWSLDKINLGMLPLL